MATFPALSTNAVAQYPATKSIQFQNQKLRFVDGAEQRYRDSAGPLHRWVITLARLVETEMAALDQFFIENQGRFESFAFTDPWNSTSYPNCSLMSDELDLTSIEDFQGKVSLTVIENRG